MSEIKNNRRSKRKFTSEEKRNYYEAWKQSELNTEAFCRTHHISKSALYIWAKHFEKAIQGPDFTPIFIKNAPALKSIDKIALTITFEHSPMQLKLEVTADHLTSLIQEIGHAATIIR